MAPGLASAVGGNMAINEACQSARSDGGRSAAAWASAAAASAISAACQGRVEPGAGTAGALGQPLRRLQAIERHRVPAALAGRGRRGRAQRRGQRQRGLDAGLPARVAGKGGPHGFDQRGIGHEHDRVAQRQLPLLQGLDAALHHRVPGHRQRVAGGTDEGHPDYRAHRQNHPASRCGAWADVSE